MATRYAVAATFTWDGVAGVKWATISGGVGGASAPTLADDVFFDAATPVGVVSISGGVCKSLDCTGYTGQIKNTGSSGFSIAGGLLLVPGMTWGPFVGGVLRFVATGGGPWPIDFGGHTVGYGLVSWQGIGGSWKVISNPLTATAMQQTAGSLDISGLTISSTTWNGSAAVDFSNSTWTISGATNAWIQTVGPIVSTGSELIFPNVSGLQKAFTSSGFSYDKVTFSGGGGPYNFNGSNSIVTLTLAPGVIVQGGPTETLDALDAVGTPISLITIFGTIVLSKSSGDVVCDYLNLSNTSAIGGARWFAGSHSIDGGGVHGWIFSDPPPVSGSFLGARCCPGLGP